MKRTVKRGYAALLFLLFSLCFSVPGYADVAAPGFIVYGFGAGVVLVIAALVIALSLLIRSLGRSRKQRQNSAQSSMEEQGNGERGK